MHLTFTLESANGAAPLEVRIDRLVIVGWAGRDPAAVEHHIEELAAIGVPRPSQVPLFYRVASNQLVQDEVVQVVGDASSGEVEAFVFAAAGDLYVSVASDHTDRVLERRSVALAKQLCAKPVARVCWRLDEVAAHWDELRLRAFIEEDGVAVAYQDGALADLLRPLDLIVGLTGGTMLPDGTAMACGTVAAIGRIRSAAGFMMELVDPVLGRTIRHPYRTTVLQEVT